MFNEPGPVPASGGDVMFGVVALEDYIVINALADTLWRSPLHSHMDPLKESDQPLSRFARHWAHQSINGNTDKSYQNTIGKEITDSWQALRKTL